MRFYKALFCLVFITTQSFALPSWFPQESNTEIGGYLKELPYFVFSSDNNDFNNLIHFRTDVKWYPWSNLTFEVGGRLQLYTGDAFENIGMPDSLFLIYGEDAGYADLADAWQSLLYGNIDRAWVGLEYGFLNIMLGRQRINWGTNLVWNPNDWYNTFNFIDFDYEERPGTDAIHMQLYLSPVSVIELAAEAGRDQVNRTFAAMYKFNINGFDLQLQSGLYGLDAASGFSWSGSVAGGGFRGEIAYFQQVINKNENDFTADSSGNFVAAVSGDYTFPGSLYLHGEFLYNGFGTNGEIFSTQTFGQISAKSLLSSVFGIFGEIGYTFSPLVYGAISAVTNPADFSFYLAPTVNWSVFQDVDLYTIAQLFFGRKNTLYGNTDDLLAFRVRWSF